jgi:hypothetical protein
LRGGGFNLVSAPKAQTFDITHFGPEKR